jgi:hypothetical protein
MLRNKYIEIQGRKNIKTINYVEIKPYEETHWLFIDFKKAYDSIRKDSLHNIPIDFGMPMKNVLK